MVVLDGGCDDCRVSTFDTVAQGGGASNCLLTGKNDVEAGGLLVPFCAHVTEVVHAVGVIGYECPVFDLATVVAVDGLVSDVDLSVGKDLAEGTVVCTDTIIEADALLAAPPANAHRSVAGGVSWRQAEVNPAIVERGPGVIGKFQAGRSNRVVLCERNTAGASGLGRAVVSHLFNNLLGAVIVSHPLAGTSVALGICGAIGASKSVAWVLIQPLGCNLREFSRDTVVGFNRA